MFFIRILNVHEDVLTLLIYDGAFSRKNTLAQSSFGAINAVADCHAPGAAAETSSRHLM
jgi:hypothetical protein